MYINPIKYSKEALPENYNNFKSLINQSFEFVKGTNLNQLNYNVLNLTFWYYYNSKLDHIGAFRNGIWIRLTNHNLENKPNIWLFILINELDSKKVIIYTDKKIMLLPMLKELKYDLPQYNGGIVEFPKSHNGVVFGEGDDVAQKSDKALLKDLKRKLDIFI